MQKLKSKNPELKGTAYAIVFWLLFSLGFALLFYGSGISFQWEYFNWKPFLEKWFFFLFLYGIIVGGALWGRHKRQKEKS